MKALHSFKSGIATAVMLLTVLTQHSDASLIITGILDGPRTGGLPKALELYVTANIADLSIYDLQNYNNGLGTPVTTFALSGSATAGQYLYIGSESPGFTAYFAFSPTLTSGVVNVNGNDAVVLRQNSTVIDSFGVIGVDPAVDTAWNYLDTWFYRVSGTSANPTFQLGDWTFAPGQSDALDVLGTSGVNPSTGNPLHFPIGTYAPLAVPEPSRALLMLVGFAGLFFRRKRC